MARLEQIGQKHGISPSGTKCAGMAGIIQESDKLINRQVEPSALDAGLIAMAQRIEHYEMAGYGTLRQYARLLGDTEAASLLQRTLDEEWETDRKLDVIAESWINPAIAASAQAPGLRAVPGKTGPGTEPPDLRRPRRL